LPIFYYKALLEKSTRLFFMPVLFCGEYKNERAGSQTSAHNYLFSERIFNATRVSCEGLSGMFEPEMATVSLLLLLQITQNLYHVNRPKESEGALDGE
jgi:hypothetical protein